MLFLCLSTMLFGLLFMGNGAFFSKLLGWEVRRNPWIYWWIGIAVTGTLSTLVSFFVPLNLAVLIAFMATGGLGILILYRAYTSGESRVNYVEKIVFICIAAIFICYLMYQLAQRTWPGSGAYDTDLYHAQTVRWLNEYGTVPGLGNLHTRLAFNSSWLSLSALLDNGPWDNRSEWIMPVLAWLGAFLYFFNEVVFARRNGVRMYALCICLWIAYSSLNISPALYYDSPVHIVNAIAVLETCYFLKNPLKNCSKEKTLSCILLLCVSAFMIKPIGAVSMLFIGLFSLFFLIRNKQPVSAWLKIYVPALCALIVWVVRNVFLSGYLLYPLPLFALPLDWTMDLAAVKGNYDAVVGWARMPGAGYQKSLENGFLFWFKPWLTSSFRSKYFLIAGALPSAFAAFFWLLVFRDERNKKHVLFFFTWSVACIVYWFVSAPDMRFGDGFFWVFLGLSLLFLIPPEPRFDLGVLWQYQKIRWTFWYASVLCVVGLLGMGGLSSKRSIVTIGTMPSKPVKEYTVVASAPFTIWIPDGDDDRSGNSPLPSAPWAVTDIEMREPGDLGQGFRFTKKN